VRRRQPKVSDFDVEILIHHYVFWLEITMHYVHSMHVIHGISDLVNEKPPYIFTLSPHTDDDIEERDWDIFHNNIFRAQVLCSIWVVDESIRSVAQQFYDVQVVQLSHHAHFLLEQHVSFNFCRQNLRFRNFYSHWFLCIYDISGQIHNCISTFTKDLLDLISAVQRRIYVFGILIRHFLIIAPIHAAETIVALGYTRRRFGGHWLRIIGTDRI